MIDFLASEPHFWDHLRPLHEALSKRYRTRVFRREPVPFDTSALAVACSFRDLKRARESGRSVVFLEHGAGQTYSSRHTSYAGGQSREGVVLFLTPGPYAHDRNLAAYPERRHLQVGVPKLDRWHTQPAKTRGRKPVVCLSFHWDCRVCPETRSAFPFYRDVIPKLADVGEYELVLHSHPRAVPMVGEVYRKTGLRWIKTFDEVLEHVDVYACDNSSTIFEFASLGRPVALLNCPHYRKSVRHGLRFWGCASVGLQCDSPEDLHRTILLAIEDDQRTREDREATIQRVYYRTDGQATARAVKAIEEILMENETATEGIRLIAIAPARDQVLLHQKLFGQVGPNWIIELHPDKVLRWDYKDREQPPVFLRKPIDPETVANRLCSPQSGTTFFRRAPQAHPVSDSDYEDLMEREILRLVRAGRTKTEVVGELSSGPVTQAEVRSAWEKLQKAGTIVPGEQRGDWEVA